MDSGKGRPTPWGISLGGSHLGDRVGAEAECEQAHLTDIKMAYAWLYQYVPHGNKIELLITPSKPGAIPQFSREATRIAVTLITCVSCYEVLKSLFFHRQRPRFDENCRVPIEVDAKSVVTQEKTRRFEKPQNLRIGNP